MTVNDTILTIFRPRKTKRETLNSKYFGILKEVPIVISNEVPNRQNDKLVVLNNQLKMTQINIF